MRGRSVVIRGNRYYSRLSLGAKNPTEPAPQPSMICSFVDRETEALRMKSVTQGHTANT